MYWSSMFLNKYSVLIMVPNINPSFRKWTYWYECFRSTGSILYLHTSTCCRMICSWNMVCIISYVSDILGFLSFFSPKGQCSGFCSWRSSFVLFYCGYSDTALLLYFWFWLWVQYVRWLLVSDRFWWLFIISLTLRQWVFATMYTIGHGYVFDIVENCERFLHSAYFISCWDFLFMQVNMIYLRFMFHSFHILLSNR